MDEETEAEPRTRRLRLRPSDLEQVQVFAKSEDRSAANMASILLREAMAARRAKQKERK